MLSLPVAVGSVKLMLSLVLLGMTKVSEHPRPDWDEYCSGNVPLVELQAHPQYVGLVVGTGGGATEPEGGVVTLVKRVEEADPVGYEDDGVGMPDMAVLLETLRLLGVEYELAVVYVDR